MMTSVQILSYLSITGLLDGNVNGAGVSRHDFMIFLTDFRKNHSFFGAVSEIFRRFSDLQRVLLLVGMISLQGGRGGEGGGLHRGDFWWNFRIMRLRILRKRLRILRKRNTLSGNYDWRGRYCYKKWNYNLWNCDSAH